MGAAFRLGACVLGLLAVPAACGATVIHVPQDYGAIGDATSVATPGDTVLVGNGLYCEHGILLRGGVCLVGETGDPGDVVIDAALQGGIVTVIESKGGCETQLVALTMRRGWAVRGGAIDACGATRLREVTFEQNRADQGGAIACEAGSLLKLEDCSFQSNCASLDGAAVFGEDLSMAVSACEFLGSWAGNAYSGASSRGGAICMLGTGSQLTLEDCALCWNQTSGGSSEWGWGGAIYIESSALVVSGCTFWENTGEHGCHVFAESGSFENTIMSHIDPGHAQLIEWYGGAPRFACCDLCGQAPGQGWYGEISDQLGASGNISEFPLFCTSPTSPPWALDCNSPCASANSGGCGLIGAADIGCENASPTEVLSWGRIKSLYR